METNKMRAQFEAVLIGHLRDEGYETPEILMGRRSDGEYVAPRARSGWWAWQASREAVVVEIEQIRSEAKRQEDGLKEMLRRQNKQICALRGKL
ncbi:hypothetical protein V0R52_01135 [Pseudomonas asiatica]|uniref:hypothetical protein n=1 Tax=Pseudomonas asiatica TaxID=2219225 RepID=UPI002E7ACEDB|nr:hypothetical protein [Pseudomonas asiatica]MEE1914987.1 hypothetical protein [Pseudomonas asiatica]